MNSQEIIDAILDTFGGADGGVSFAQVRVAIENWERMRTDDLSALQLYQVCTQFARICKMAQENRL